MIKTKIKRVIALAAITSMLLANFGSAIAATQIGTGSVSWTTSFDSVISWDDNFPWTASGSVSGIVITATVVPTLNMSISTGAIDLGTLTPWVISNGSLDLEVGTNAVDGVSITARSGSGWLTNLADNSIQINNLSTDGIVESYQYSSAITATTDSTVSGFTSTANLNTEVNNNTTEHTIYTTNKPERTNNVDDLTFTVAATADAQTQAWNYRDTVTFTITGNF